MDSSLTRVLDRGTGAGAGPVVCIPSVRCDCVYIRPSCHQQYVRLLSVFFAYSHGKIAPIWGGCCLVLFCCASLTRCVHRPYVRSFSSRHSSSARFSVVSAALPSATSHSRSLMMLVLDLSCLHWFGVRGCGTGCAASCVCGCSVLLSVSLLI